MIILDDTKTLTTLATDTSNGLGQIGCINPTITENLNGSYELEFDIATSEKYFSLLHTGGLVKCLHNTSEQIFRIYFISKAINGIVNVKAQHITYDLCGVVVKPFTATGAVSSVNGMLTNVIGSTPFTMTTDITNTTSNFTLDIPRSFRECLGGYEGSLLDTFRGEYEWDNLTVRMLAHRGADNGVRIAYGKNLTDFTQEENIENVFDAVYGYAVIDDVFYQPSGIYNKTGATTPKVKIVDFSSDYESGDTPSQADLYAKAQTYATNNDIEVPNVNIKVSFVPLWQTEEYKNILPLERVSLGDTVHVYFEKLNVEATARVIKTVWNVNLNRYDEIELGDARANLNTVINESVDSAVNNAIGDLDIDTGAIESEMFQMSKLIANGMGLHMTKDSIGRIYLHNAETLAQSQYQYQITSTGFMMSDDYGQTWNSGWTTSGEAVVNSLATITLKFLEGYGMYMRFGDINSNYIEVAPYSVNNVPQGVSFDGTGSIRMQPQGAFFVNNISSSNNYFNRLIMNKQGGYSNNFLEMLNYDDENNYLTANFMEWDAHFLDGGEKYNRLIFHNYQTVSGTQESANLVMLEARLNSNLMFLRNKKVNDGDNNANFLRFEHSVTNTRTRMELCNRDYGYNETANILVFQSNNTANNTWLSNYELGSDVLANRLAMESSGSGGSLSNSLRLINQKGGIITNSIRLNSDETNKIWSKDDLWLRSGGAVRIYANENETTATGDWQDAGYTGSTQDVYIGGYSLKLQCTNRIYLYFGANRYYLTLENDGCVHWNTP
jgi:phage minor structural protein